MERGGGREAFGKRGEDRGEIVDLERFCIFFLGKRERQSSQRIVQSR